MNPLKWIRKIGKFIRGGATPFQILMACVFGMILGLVPGFNMLHLVLVLLILTLNVSIGLSFLSFAVGKALLLPLAPITATIGRFVIEDMGISGLFVAAGDTPVLALMNLYVHCVTGGLLVAIVLGIIAGFFASRVVVTLRKGLVNVGEKRPEVAKLAAALPVRFLLALIFGRQKKPLAELLSQKNPLFRKWGIVVAMVLFGIILGGSVLAVDYYLAGQLEAQLGKANGAEVNIDQADLSLLSGKAKLVGIQFTDPQDPTVNRFEADEITVDISIRGLLTKRAIVDEIAVPAAYEGKKRETPGQVYPPEEPAEPEDEENLLWKWLENPEKIKETFDKLEKYRKWLEKIRDRIEARQKGETPPPDPNLPYLERSSQHLLTKHPTVLIRKIRIEKITLSGDPQTYRLLGQNISSHPEYVDGEMAIEFSDVRVTGDAKKDTDKMRLRVGFNFQPGKMHTLLTNVPNIPAEKFQLSDKSPILVKQGNVLLNTTGGFSAKQLSLKTTLLTTNFQASLRNKSEAPGKPQVLGLPPDTVESFLQEAAALPVVLNIGGTLSRPTVVVDVEQTGALLQPLLLKAGLSGAAKLLKERTGIDPGKILDPEGGINLPGLLNQVQNQKKDKKDDDSKTDDDAKTDEKKDDKDKPSWPIQIPGL